MIWLLDTDTVIYMIRGLNLAEPRTIKQKAIHDQGRRIFNRAKKQSLQGDQVALSAITVAELEFGARNGRNYERERNLLERIFLPFEALDFNARECAIHYGKIRHVLEAQGRGIGSLDTLIAAHALAVDATLVTNNTREFGRVDDLRVANWSAGS